MDSLTSQLNALKARRKQLEQSRLFNETEKEKLIKEIETQIKEINSSTK